MRGGQGACTWQPLDWRAHVTATTSPEVRRPRHVSVAGGYGPNAFAHRGLPSSTAWKKPARSRRLQNAILMRDLMGAYKLYACCVCVPCLLCVLSILPVSFLVFKLLSNFERPRALSGETPPSSHTFTPNKASQQPYIYYIIDLHAFGRTLGPVKQGHTSQLTARPCCYFTSPGPRRARQRE